MPPLEHEENENPDVSHEEVQSHLDYTSEELRTNRFWNVLGTLLVLCAIWGFFVSGTVSLGGAIVVSFLTLIAASVYRALFASESATKLDENSLGSGKRIKPRTMGTILGYLFDGFR